MCEPENGVFAYFLPLMAVFDTDVATDTHQGGSKSRFCQPGDLSQAEICLLHA